MGYTSELGEHMAFGEWWTMLAQQFDYWLKTMSLEIALFNYALQ